jgi:lysophospholipase L1-like esterase
MKEKRPFLFSITMLLCFYMLSTSALAQDPKRLASIGDSITEAIDAEVYGPNHWASWANGYHGFWQWLFGLSNVNSHNQRITREFGRRGRKNFMEAESGADSFDLPSQAMQAVAHQATYVPWLMGQNDICQDSEGEIPTDAEFRANAVAALEILRDGLPQGATVYIVGMVDVTRLFNIAMQKKALGIVDCEVLWFFTIFELFPCGTILGPFRTDADRDAMRLRIEGFNLILQDLVNQLNAGALLNSTADLLPDPDHDYFYTAKVFNYPFAGDEVSDLDCFHPSPDGQRNLSRITWKTMDGPRFEDW